SWHVPSKNRRGYSRNQKAQKAHDAGGNRRSRCRPADDRVHPAEQESPLWAKRAAQVRVFTACFGNGGAELRVGKCAEDGKSRADDPRGKYNGNRASFAGHFGWFQENAGADHCADDDGSGSPRAKAAYQFKAARFAHTRSST